MKLDRQKIEQICWRAQLSLEKRQQLGPYELFIAAGESKPPHFRYQRLGLEPTDFPLGCYVTIWWLLKDEDSLVIAVPAFYEKNHDPQIVDKKRARLNTCAQEAQAYVEAGKRARLGLRPHA